MAKIELSPADQYNQQLIQNVHPGDWANPEPASNYNLVVIGAGTAGLITAAGAAGLGAKVALVERYLLGGDCLNVGCVPSKALIRASRAVVDVRDAGEMGVQVHGEVSCDFSQVMERMRRLRTEISHHDSAKRYRDELGVEVFLGEAKFTGLRTIQVGDSTLHFSKAVIATGARAADPNISGIQEVGYLTNETVFSLTELPRRLGVIGAGPIGCELAQAFARFGSEVTVLGNHPQVLPKEDRDAADIVEQSMRKDGVEFVLDCNVTRVELRDGAKVIVVSCPDGREQEVIVDEILVGVGRTPNVNNLGLEQAGVTYDLKTGVEVNDHLRTSNKRIFAAGDVCSRFKFTHMADALARIVIRNALFWGRQKASKLIVPWCTYTDPEIAHVGLYPKEADEQGIAIDTFQESLSEVDRAVLDGETTGFVKIHVKKGTEKIIGATIVARHAGEMISELTLAMVSNTGLKTLGSTIHPYPTQAEAIKRVADAYNRTRLTPFLRKVFKKWLSWSR